MANPIDVVQIVSSDGHSFFLDKKCALVSRVVENMINTPGSSLSMPVFLLYFVILQFYVEIVVH
jgi:hypothetical protein